MHRHLVDRHMSDQIGGCGSLFIAAIIAVPVFAISLDDLRHITLALVGVVTGIRVGWIADGIARHIL